MSLLLQQEMENIDNEAAIKIYENWDSSTYVVGMRREAIEEKALLNAYQLEKYKNRNFQVPKVNTKLLKREE